MFTILSQPPVQQASVWTPTSMKSPAHQVQQEQQEQLGWTLMIILKVSKRIRQAIVYTLWHWLQSIAMTMSQQPKPKPIQTKRYQIYWVRLSWSYWRFPKGFDKQLYISSYIDCYQLHSPCHNNPIQTDPNQIVSNRLGSTLMIILKVSKRIRQAIVYILCNRLQWPCHNNPNQNRSKPNDTKSIGFDSHDHTEGFQKDSTSSCTYPLTLTDINCNHDVTTQSKPIQAKPYQLDWVRFEWSYWCFMKGFDKQLYISSDIDWYQLQSPCHQSKLIHAKPYRSIVMIILMLSERIRQAVVYILWHWL